MNLILRKYSFKFYSSRTNMYLPLSHLFNIFVNESYKATILFNTVLQIFLKRTNIFDAKYVEKCRAVFVYFIVDFSLSLAFLQMF